MFKKISGLMAKVKSSLFENRGTRQTVTKNAFWLSVSQIGSRLIRAVIIIYSARILGAEEYGVFSYVLSFAGFFTIFADIGVNALLTRDTASHPERRSEYFATSFWIKTLQIFITVLLVIFVAPHLTSVKGAAYLIPFVALLVLFDNLRDFATSYLRGLEKMELEALILMVMNIAIMVAGFIILYFSHTAKALLLSYIASVGLSAILAVIIVREKFFKIFKYFNKELAKKILSASWPFAFSSALGIFMLNTDIVMLGWWRTTAEIGYYSAGIRITQVFYALPTIFVSSIFPVVSRLINQDKKEETRIVNERSMALVFMFAIPLIVGGVVLGEPIFNLVYGKEYLPGALGFQILATTMFWIFPGMIISNLVLAHNLQKKSLIYIAAGSLGNIVFNALLIPRWGIAGSAISTFIALALNYGLTWIMIKKYGNFKTFTHLKKITAAAIIMGAIAFVLDKTGLNVIVNISISGAAYFVILLLFKEKVLREFAFIKNRLLPER
ncbi:MAG: flippase [Candidatus Wolfebacteria bacterium]|nr:flippase [Candidatus Wolfebacteria bacterium]